MDDKAKHDAQFTNTIDQILKMHESRRLNEQSTYNLFVPDMQLNKSNQNDVQTQKEYQQEIDQFIRESQVQEQNNSQKPLQVSADSQELSLSISTNKNNTVSPQQISMQEVQDTPLSKSKAQQELEEQLSILQNDVYSQASDRRLTNAESMKLSSRFSVSQSQQAQANTNTQQHVSIYQSNSSQLQKSAEQLKDEVEQYYQQIMSQ